VECALPPDKPIADVAGVRLMALTSRSCRKYAVESHTLIEVFAERPMAIGVTAELRH
jgi:hypothetical protein